MSGLHEERAKLAEDEEKLESALREYDNEWSEEDEEDDDEDCLLIDLDQPISTSDVTGRSISPSFAESGSHVTGQEEESADGPSAPDLPQLSSKEVETSEAEKTLALNRALQGILEKHMEDIQLALEENKQKQQMLEDGCWKDDYLHKRKGRTIGPFRTPFFQNGLSFPPINEDVKVKKCSGELSFEDMHESLSFTQTSRANLMDGVLENLREEMMKPLMTRLDAEVTRDKNLEKQIDEIESFLNLAKEDLKMFDHKRRPQKSAKLKKVSTKEGTKKLTSDVKELEQTLAQAKQRKKDQSEIMAAIEGEMERMKETDFSYVLKSLDVEIIDWMKISKMRFGEKTSWLDCRKEWEHVMNPSLNKGPWTKPENKRLVELVKKYPSGKWDVIAEELGTKRTPFMCLNHYQRNLNPEFKSRPWTAEEDKHLLEVTKNIRENSSFFSWRKVSALVDSRSWTECLNRMSRLDSGMNHGRWTKEEDARLLAAIEILGPSWAKISRYIRHRTPTQIRDRYIHCLDPNLNFSFFTYDEDVKLIRLYNEGCSWTGMLKEFEGRTDSMLYARYKTLKGWQKEMEWWQSQTPETQKMLLGRSLIPTEREAEEQRLKKYYSTRLGIEEGDYERQKLDLEKGVDPQFIPPRPPMHLMYTKFSRFRRAHNMERWSNKLAFHARLKEKLKYLIAREQVKLQHPNSKGKMEEEETEKDKQAIMKVIYQSADETLQGFKPITRLQYQEMYSALNKYFLGESKINVKELLQTCKNLRKKKYQRKAPCPGYQVNAELRAILRNNNRCTVKRGRNRKLLPRDGRSFGKIQTEFEEVKRSIDVLLLECLGPGFLHFCHAVKHRNLDVEEELLKLISFEDDENYKRTAKAIEHRMMEVQNHPLLKPFERERNLSRFRKTLKKLQSLVRSHYAEKQKKLDCVLEEMHREATYIDNLEERQSELPREFLSHMSVSENCSKAARHLIASPMTSAVLVPQNPQGSAKELVKDDGMEEKDHTTRSASLRKRKQLPEQIEAPWKKLRCNSLEEVNNERLKLPLLKERQITEVPYLPPMYHTLVALRALLLSRQELLKQAGDLYNTGNYRKTTSQQSEYGDIECVGMSYTNREEDGRMEVEAISFTGDSDRGLDSHFKQPDKGILLRKIDKAATRPAVTSSSSQLHDSETISFGQSFAPQQNQNQTFQLIKNAENKFDQQLKQLVPAKRESAYEVSIGVAAATRCFKHMAHTDCQKLPEDEMAPTLSAAVTKALHLPEVTHKVYIPECLDTCSLSGQGLADKPSPDSSSYENQELNSPVWDESGNNFDYGKELQTQMKVAADFAMNKFLRRQSVQSTENVVVVGVDPVTRHIVHFKPKPGMDELTAVESMDPHPEVKKLRKKKYPFTATNDLQKVQKALNPAEQTFDANIIHAIRQTVEYKAFAARMHSLFMWPVLLSTTTPPEVLKVTAEEKAAKPKKVERGRRRYITKDGRKEMKKQRREKREARERAKQEAKAAGIELKIRMRKPKSCVLPTPPPEPKSGRPVRKVRLKAQAMKAEAEKSTPSPWGRVVPNWWKSAVLAAMLTQQAIEQGKIPKEEKNLSEDEDFQDKGNYSDDEEWLAPLLEQERKEKEAIRRIEEAERECGNREEEEENGEEEGQEVETMEVDETEKRHLDD